MTSNYKRRLEQRRYRMGNHILQYLETEIAKMSESIDADEWLAENADRFYFGLMENLVDVLVSWPMVSPRTALEMKLAYLTVKLPQ